MKTVISGALGVYLLLSAVAEAQPMLEPRFKLEALSFKAIDENGLDWPFSDEVYVTIWDPARKVATRSKIFTNVDAGETKTIPFNQSCILPIAGLNGPTLLEGSIGDTWSCARFGAPGPLSFTVALYEKDPCDYYFPLAICFEHGIVPGDEPPPINRVDDLIGRQEVKYSMQELIALQVGQVLEESIWLTPSCPSDSPDNCGGWDWPVYQFTWRITRLLNAPPATPVVDSH
jgi:hypothetical protein